MDPQSPIGSFSKLRNFEKNIQIFGSDYETMNIDFINIKWNEFLKAISKKSTLAATCYPELEPWHTHV